MKKGNRLGSWIGLFSFVLLLSSFSSSQAQDKCVKVLEQADKSYYAGDFDKAIELLSGCLRQGGLSAEVATRAYKLLAWVYIANNDTARANVSIRKLLEVASNYQPNPNEDPPEMIEMVRQIRQEQERQREEEKRRQLLLQQEQLQKQQPPPQPEKPMERVTPVKKSSKKWLWIGLGTAALGGGAVAVLVGGGNGGGQPPTSGNGKLPDPPGEPTSN